MYLVRTIPNRKIDASYSQIKFSTLCDYGNQPIDSFIQAMYKISDEDSFLLEDDLVLCNNFEVEAGNAVERYPDRIINFFQAPSCYRPVIEQPDIWFNQCTYYPRGVAKQIADIMITLPRGTGIRKNQYSKLESVALKRLNIQVVQYRPHLVQHLDFDTFLFPKTYNNRRSPFFIDYLNKLGITYDEAYSHLQELRALMKDHFEELCKQRQL